MDEEVIIDCSNTELALQSLYAHEESEQTLSLEDAHVYTLNFMHMRNAVTLVWGSLRLTPIMIGGTIYSWIGSSYEFKLSFFLL